jgi:hypothetical protein
MQGRQAVSLSIWLAIKMVHTSKSVDVLEVYWYVMACAFIYELWYNCGNYGRSERTS